VLSTPQFWRVFVVAILVNHCLYFLLNWLPLYFSQQWSMTTKDLTWILTLIFLGLDLGYLFCGAVVLWLTRFGWRLARSRQAVFFLATVLLGGASLVLYARDPDLIVALLVTANFGAGIWIAMYLTMAQEITNTHVSTAAGLLGGSRSLAGALAMWRVGKVTRQTSSFTGPLACVAVAAVIAAIAGITVVRHRPSGATQPLS
jgi:sugar phosphate permease